MHDCGTHANFLYGPSLLQLACLSLSAGPLGVFLLLQRMTLVGDALSHGLMPGVTLGYLIFGPSVVLMGICGFVTSILLACMTTIISYRSALSDEAAWAGLYLLSVALGVVFLSEHPQELGHVLFGSLAALSPLTIKITALVSFLTVLFFLFCHRHLLQLCFDPVFFLMRGGHPQLLKILFMAILALNLITASQCFGTMMALGLIILPALIMHFVHHNFFWMCIGASAIAFGSSLLGWWICRWLHSPCGAVIIIILGIIYTGAYIIRIKRSDTILTPK